MVANPITLKANQFADDLLADFSETARTEGGRNEIAKYAKGTKIVALALAVAAIAMFVMSILSFNFWVLIPLTLSLLLLHDVYVVADNLQKIVKKDLASWIDTQVMDFLSDGKAFCLKATKSTLIAQRLARILL